MSCVQTAMPVRVMKLIGVENLIVTNAGGGLNNMFTVFFEFIPFHTRASLIQVGDIMVLKDHINLPGFACQHPLKGPNDEKFGPRFFPTNDLYNKKYRDIARQVSTTRQESLKFLKTNFRLPDPSTLMV